MNRNPDGRYKNDPGRSQDFYRPLAEKFIQGRDGDFIFDLDPVSGRAYIAEDDPSRPQERLLLYFIWQEDWSNPWSRRKFMKGKICYQKSVAGNLHSETEFFARRYEIRDGRIRIATMGEERIRTVLPPDRFQATCAVSF